LCFAYTGKRFRRFSISGAFQEQRMKKEFDWFDKPENLRKLRFFSYILLAVSVLVEFIVPAHGTGHAWDRIPGFYALFGFVICAAMIIVSKLLGQFWLKKSEDYYDR
jgi:hypothetical protein